MSTVMGWLGDSPPQVVTLDVLSMKEQQLQGEVLLLRRRIRKLLFLLRLLLAPYHHNLRSQDEIVDNDMMPVELEAPRLTCGGLAHHGDEVKPLTKKNIVICQLGKGLV